MERTHDPVTGKLACGHDDDFAHALTVIIGVHWFNRPLVMFEGSDAWHKVQTELIEDIKDLFVQAKAEQPSTVGKELLPPLRFRAPASEKAQ